jgi:5-oxoprolinase (ATP-hydrolysing) subunit C
MTELVAKACGPRTSLQDGGRIGYQRFGVSNSGAMDRLALAAANCLVGNESGAAAIEFMLLGGSFVCEGGSARVALAGAQTRATLDGQPIATDATILMRAGQTLTIGPAQAGVYMYLAASGSFDIDPQLGSVSLHQRAGLGGMGGRALQPGDRIPLWQNEPSDTRQWMLPPLAVDPNATIRVVLGPQDDHFRPKGIATFLSAAYTVTQEADRMGYRLAGPKIDHSQGYNIVSDGIVSGSVQVPGGGEPIVMMADRQTTGGYPKIATVISADLRLVAQKRPGDCVKFTRVSVGEAQRVARERAHLVSTMPTRMVPARGGLPSLEELLDLNLAGAAVDALSPECDRYER